MFQMMKTRKDSVGSLIHVPSCLKDSIIKFSSSYNSKQVDNYYNLVQQTDTQAICMICL